MERELDARVGHMLSAPRWPPPIASARVTALADVLIVGVLVAVAAAVRVPYLWDVPRFTDEVNEALRGLAIARGQAYPLTNVDPYIGPLWNYLLAGAFLLGGPSLYTPRAVVAGLGVLTVAPTYLLGRGFGGRWVGTLAALFLALSPVHIAVNSHIAWSNCVTPLLTTLALWLTHRAVASGRPRGLVWGGLGWGLAFGTHPTAVLFGPDAALYVAVARPRWLRERWPWLAVALALAACSTLIVENGSNNLSSITVGMHVQERYAGGEALDLDVYHRRPALRQPRRRPDRGRPATRSARRPARGGAAGVRAARARSRGPAREPPAGARAGRVRRPAAGDQRPLRVVGAEGAVRRPAAAALLRLGCPAGRRPLPTSRPAPGRVAARRATSGRVAERLAAPGRAAVPRWLG